ncbi:hypothetical protein DL766_005616 [Monosporascus sp. MC13-8B]|uniref:SSCRP protein n=1 Tax=Monosporascus cannonballus TaxID=155416 RepID=A0ABY0GSE1_9PEZI|nr:hypothetical protein DL762_010059 [Monosporascus cannonballus]RYO76756.1 hypothetical protein DL763_010143 [Monosporascus cannonballus]RYP28914.1 hypothetical protein DL766_005616 [Monosporascus sp. MC13-8B]
MQFLKTAILGLSLATASLSQPLEDRQIQIIYFTFHGGPASYQLAVPDDGTVMPTNNNIAVSIIDTPDYNALALCDFNTAGVATLQPYVTPDGLQQIIVGPPQPIISVSCKGKCVPTYGECYINGQFVGPCCDGFCAANRCRPWNISGP